MSPSTLCKTSLILLALALLSQNDLVLVRGDPTLVGSYCEATSGTYSSSGDNFTVNLEEVGTSILQDASGGAFFSNITVGSGDDQVFGLYYCNGAFDATDCNACVVAATQQIQDSCNTKEAIVWYLECTVRKSGHILSQVEVSPYKYLPLNQNVSDMTTFSTVLVTTLTTVVKEAAYNTTSEPPAFAAAQGDISSTESLVAVAQCTPDIVGAGCSDCLLAAMANMTTCCSDSVGSVVFLPSCQLLYAINYASDDDNSTTPASTNSNPFTGITPSTSTATPSTPKSAGKGKPSKSSGSVMTSSSNAIAGIMTAIGFLFFMSLDITF